MRSTAPTLRRRKNVRNRANRRWLKERDDSDADVSGDSDGGGSDGDDSDEDVRVARPATRLPSNTNTLVRPSVGQGTASGSSSGTISGSVGTGGSNRVVSPVFTPVVASPVASPVTVVAPVAGGSAVVGGSNGGSNLVLPGTTLGVGEDGLESASDSVSDGIESGEDSESGDENSGDEVASTTTTAPPPPDATAPALAPPAEVVQPGLTTSSADTTTTPPPPTETTSTAAPPPPDTTTSSRSTSSSSSTTVVALPAVTEASSASNGGVRTPPLPAQTRTSTFAGDVATTTSRGIPALLTPTLEPTPLPTLQLPSADPGSLPTSAIGDALPETSEGVTNPGNALGPIAAESPGMNGGAAAGIVIGALALISVIIAGAFFWRRFRRNGGELSPLPFFNRKPDTGRSPDNDMTYNGTMMEKDTIPILPPPSLGPKKTNSEMMDSLIQATYRTEGGMDNRSSQATSAFGQPSLGQQTFGGQQAVAHQDRGPGFMNEKTYTALAGPPTPAGPPNRRSKPVFQWLDGIKTPRESMAPSEAGTRWPDSEAPPMPRPTPGATQPMPRTGPPLPSPWHADPLPIGRPPMPQFLPPQPAFANNGRYTATTTTTTTSGSEVWYG